MAVITQTERLIIREFLPEELETYLNHFVDERVLQYIPKRSREERVTIFNNALNQYSETKTKGIWGIFSKADDSFMGSCLLRQFAGDADVIELGYSLNHEHWGKGIGSEMVTAMVSYGFMDKCVSEIVAVTELENTGSQRVLEKAGLKRVDNLIRDGLELAYFRLPR
ncbi:GNAT family N-acetyltransferase [Mucilaginibacter sp. UYCu711]|uniref:GNAT family N-acetyltransferase n=1 Tax=Mucilaginibacter sp. UYCu711 TaxID=3156339 RepID=UPI003D1E6220